MSDIVGDLKSWRSLLREHALHHGKSELPGNHNIDKLTRAIEEIERLRAELKRVTAGGDDMRNVYIEPRPKGRPEGDPIDDYVVEATPTMSSPPSGRSARLSNGRRRMAMHPMSRAFGT